MRGNEEFELRTVGNVEPDRGNGRSGREGHRTTETRQAEDEAQRANEPYWYDGKQTILSASAVPDSDENHERTNRHESGNATDGQLCSGIWSLESRHRD